ncbi:hypothetical protein BURPS1106B_A3185 [Burkholderia pseudomallei 1106b]|uniref:Uncharacterized protein n=1 Tax=Burkholderia pseudomallei (strain 1106a) TaxID=357348 RepID=A3P0T2_BURP0|nr:hypothetical protein BURPS668_3901 [Burkholderia pseudomallei 668]ABN89928.1 hypothetical protein BURPS1106A_3983 [Burkholderia pseudomallei 1106a]EES26998.1 hypothetical protein BURPS1106B_A3185 [Burkholderia pseudomallei 1106b]
MTPQSACRSSESSPLRRNLTMFVRPSPEPVDPEPVPFA